MGLNSIITLIESDYSVIPSGRGYAKLYELNIHSWLTELIPDRIVLLHTTLYTVTMK